MVRNLIKEGTDSKVKWKLIITFPFLHLCSSVQNWREEVIEYIHRGRAAAVLEKQTVFCGSSSYSNCLSKITKTVRGGRD